MLIPVAQVSAWDLCIKMAAKGVLAKPTHVRHTMQRGSRLLCDDV